MRKIVNSLPKYQKILYRLFFFSRLTELARFCNRRNTTILCYHGITERVGPDPGDRSAIAVDRTLFFSHLKYLKRHYNVIGLREYLTARQNGNRLRPHSVILTFDDGLRNFLTVAAPALNEFRFPAAVFLVTDQVEARDASTLSSTWVPLDDRISLSWEEAKSLQSSQGIEFGSHTCSHPEFPQLSLDLDRELDGSFEAVRENLHESLSPSLAYPYGDYSDRVAEKARLTGYSCALSTEAGANSNKADLFKLRRAVVRRYDSTEIFAARVSGLVGWLRIARDVFRRLSLPLVRLRKPTVDFL